MDPLPVATATKARKGRGRWVLLFLVAGLIAVFSAMVLPFSPTAALPWVAISWPVAVVSGYRIWRADHPGESGRAAVGLRVKWLLTLAGITIYGFAFRAAPWLLVATWIFVGALVLVDYARPGRR